MEIFLQIANRGSFTAAASHLGLSKASVTKHIASLERALGAQLLHRNAHKVRLTEAGTTALNMARPLLEAYEGMEAHVRESTSNPRGVLRVGTPPALGTHHLVPVIMSFCRANPDIRIVLLKDDGTANLVTQGLDLSLRVVPASEDAGYVVVPLMRSPQLLVASPAYLQRCGTPSSADDLAQHNCLIHTGQAPTGMWHFDGPRGATSVKVSGSLQSNLGEPLLQAAVHGLGISMHPTYMISNELKARRLQWVLPDHEPRGFDISVIYPTRQHLPLRVRKFLDHLKDWARTPPEWTRLPPRSAARGPQRLVAARRR